MKEEDMNELRNIKVAVAYAEGLTDKVKRAEAMPMMNDRAKIGAMVQGLMPEQGTPGYNKLSLSIFDNQGKIIVTKRYDLSEREHTSNTIVRSLTALDNAITEGWVSV